MKATSSERSLNIPLGYFTVEQWKRSAVGETSQWIPILHLDSYQSLTNAIAALEKRGEPGLFRVLQMQRCVWAEMESGKLRLHGSHASSPENLAQIVEIFEREGGRRPVEKALQGFHIKTSDRIFHKKVNNRYSLQMRNRDCPERRKPLC
jgi:hypothetical protein